MSLPAVPAMKKRAMTCSGIEIDRGGESWFATVDELHRKRRSEQETYDSAYRRLRSALDAARDVLGCPADIGRK